MNDPAALQLTGSTTLLPRMQQVAEAYMRQYGLRVVINHGCGTARGYKALLDGTTDIAMASGAAPGTVTAIAAARGLAFRETIVTRDAILPLVHHANPLATLELRQLRNIFTGRIRNWRFLAGPDQPIEVLVGPPTGGVTNSWRRQVLGDDDTFSPLAQVMGSEDRVAHVSRHPWAITYIPEMAPGAPAVKILRVDGKSAAPANQAYPLHAPMMLVTLDPPTPAAARLIAFAARAGASAGTGAAHE